MLTRQFNNRFSKRSQYPNELITVESDAFDPLANLRDINLPADVSWWPPAPGWWLLFLLLLTLGWLCVRAVVRWHYSPRRSALRLLQTLRRDLPNNKSNVLTLRAISVLLRRCALTQYPSMNIAGLIGEQWLQFLDETGKTSAFSQGPGQALGEASYQKDLTYDADAVFALVEQWIRQAMPGIKYES